jgi:hypothetical protein
MKDLNLMFLSNFVEKIKSNGTKDQTRIFSLILNILIPLYKISNDEIKKNITAIVKEELLNKFRPDLYYYACIAGIVEVEEKFEEKFIIKAQEIIETAEQDIKNGKFGFPPPIETYMSYITNLVYANNIKDLTKYSVFKGKNDFFDLIFEPENFDYNKFDLNWLIGLPDNLHKKILAIDNVKTIIKEKFKNLLLEEEVNKELKKIYFNFYS